VEYVRNLRRGGRLDRLHKIGQASQK
jgi:hypothetical protein